MRKNKYKTFIIAGAMVLIILAMFLVFRLQEDSWIKDERGIYVKHGNPSEVPDYVDMQMEIIKCAYDLYNNSKESGIIFNSQCLGTCNDYAVDVVNVPRTSEDNLPENQCVDYREGKVNHFIELDNQGNVIRVV